MELVFVDTKGIFKECHRAVVPYHSVKRPVIVGKLLNGRSLFLEFQCY